MNNIGGRRHQLHPGGMEAATGRMHIEAGATNTTTEAATTPSYIKECATGNMFRRKCDPVSPLY